MAVLWYEFHNSQNVPRKKNSNNLDVHFPIWNEFCCAVKSTLGLVIWASWRQYLRASQALGWGNLRQWDFDLLLRSDTRRSHVSIDRRKEPTSGSEFRGVKCVEFALAQTARGSCIHIVIHMQINMICTDDRSCWIRCVRSFLGWQGGFVRRVVSLQQNDAKERNVPAEAKVESENCMLLERCFGDHSASSNHISKFINQSVQFLGWLSEQLILMLEHSVFSPFEFDRFGLFLMVFEAQHSKSTFGDLIKIDLPTKRGVERNRSVPRFGQLGWYVRWRRSAESTNCHFRCSKADWRCSVLLTDPVTIRAIRFIMLAMSNPHETLNSVYYPEKTMHLYSVITGEFNKFHVSFTQTRQHKRQNFIKNSQIFIFMTTGNSPEQMSVCTVTRWLFHHTSRSVDGRSVFVSVTLRHWILRKNTCVALA